MPAATFDFRDTLKSVEIGGHQRYEALEIFHLRWTTDSSGPDYLTLDEALENNGIEVAESSEHGQVPQIKIINRTNRMVFLMAGEQLVGCKQNRVLNASIMVPPRREMPLPVTCVEAGRWGYKTPVFSNGHTSSHHHLRAMMDRQVAQSYKSSGSPRSDQAAVWGEVSRKMAAVGSYSPSSELQAIYRDHERKLAESVEQLPAPEGFHGALFNIAGEISGADLFDKPETLRKLWPKLVRSCVIDSLEASKENPKSTPMQDATAWLERGSGAVATKFPSPGVGLDIRLEGKDIFGAALVVEDQPVHVELFSSVGAHSRPESRRGRGIAPGGVQQSVDVVPNRTGRGGNWLNRIFRREPAA